MHYERWRAHGDPTVRKVGGTALKGRPKSPEHRRRISEAKKGQPKSAEHRRRIAETLRRRKGDHISYKAAHYRVYAARGRPSRCEDCGTTDSTVHFEWANLTGRYHDPADYIRLCKSCHNRMDGIVRNLRG
jgi:hypothetical protein